MQTAISHISIFMKNHLCINSERILPPIFVYASFRLEASTDAADAIDKNTTIDAPPCCSPPWENDGYWENTLPELTGFAAWK